jgi:hypothetical protein
MMICFYRKTADAFALFESFHFSRPSPLQLECCDGIEQGASQCSAYAACSGLVGDCCPTEVRLEYRSRTAAFFKSLRSVWNSPYHSITVATTIILQDGEYLDCCKNRSRERDTFVFLGTISFDDLEEDSTVTTYEGLTWTNFVVSLTSPSAPSSPRAAIPTSSTPSFELSDGVFSLISIDIAGSEKANPVTVRGFDSSGTETVSKTVSFLTTYATYDFSEFTNIAKVEFEFGVANAAGLDNFVFV